MCRVLEVSASGYYAWRKRPASQRAQDDGVLLRRIRTIHEASRQSYGVPRVYRELREDDVEVGRDRVARLMRQAGLRGISRRCFVTTTRRDQTTRPAPDLVERRFAAEGPNQLWVADITYIPTWAGFLYLAIVLDVFSRKVVGWAMEAHLRTELVLQALQMAIEQRKPEGVIHHSDQGCQLGFKEPSQHLNNEDSRWRNEGSEHRITHYAHPCSHPAGHRPAGASTDSGSGVGSPRGCRANKQERRPAYLPLSAHDGFARVAAWHPCRSDPCRSAISRSPRGKRSLSYVRGASECVRSPAASAGLRQRSLASFVGMPQRGAGHWATGPPLPSGTRIGVHVAQRSRSLLRMTG
jgi:putative transposase